MKTLESIQYKKLIILQSIIEIFTQKIILKNLNYEFYNIKYEYFYWNIL